MEIVVRRTRLTQRKNTIILKYILYSVGISKIVKNKCAYTICFFFYIYVWYADKRRFDVCV